jgi:uncharacterized protein YjbI with pentapeptide repeats
MADPEHLEILKQGTEAWNEWRGEHPNIRPDLSHADLRYAVLSEAILRYADLRYAVLIHANLSYADLSHADLRDAILSEAVLRKAVLREADLSRANLSGADLTNCDLGLTIFGDIDLSQTKGLESVRHLAPSTIGTDTIYKSRGEIPALFLRGCGLSDWEIEATKLHHPGLGNAEINDILYNIYGLRAHQAIQINPLFISYNHQDGQFVDEMEGLLNHQGIRFWRDIHHAVAGRLEKQVDRAIRLNPIVLIVLSTNSIKSDWVQHEVHLARKLQLETGRDTLCPIALDDSWKTCGWPERLLEQMKEYHILDFSKWQDKDYLQRMFTKLIEGLDLFYK